MSRTCTPRHAGAELIGRNALGDVRERVLGVRGVGRMQKPSRSSRGLSELLGVRGSGRGSRLMAARSVAVRLSG